MFLQLFQSAIGFFSLCRNALPHIARYVLGKLKYTPEYKAKLVLEALREETTMSEIASREGINLKQLSNWKTEFLENASRAFSKSKDEKKAAREVAEMKAREREYQAKVGQLTLEVDFLKSAHEKVYGPGWESKYGFRG